MARDAAGADGHAGEAAGDETEDGQEVVGGGLARVGTGTFGCRYAGVMLLHAYLDRVGAESIFGTLTGARRAGMTT